MKKINHICVVTNLFPPFPYETAGMFLYNLIEAFVHLGVNCTVIRPVSITKRLVKKTALPPKVEMSRCKDGRIEVRSPRFFSFSDKNAFWLERSYQAKARAVVREYKAMGRSFDAVYCQFLTSGRAGLLLHKKFGVPFFTAHGESDFMQQFDQYKKSMIVDFYQQSTGIISVSSPIQKFILDNFGDIEEKIAVEPNAINTKLFYPRNKMESRKALGLPYDQTIVVFVGYLNRRKGATRLAQAMEGLDSVHAYLIGNADGDVPEQTANVHICGEKVQSELITYLSAADMFVLPTLAEGSCNAIVEAMGCGLPVISSDRDFNRNILDESCSLLVNPMDVAEIREAIRTLANDKQLREKMAQAALEKAQGLDIMERAKRILKFMENRL